MAIWIFMKFCNKISIKTHVYFNLFKDFSLFGLTTKAADSADVSVADHGTAGLQDCRTAGLCTPDVVLLTEKFL